MRGNFFGLLTSARLLSGLLYCLLYCLCDLSCPLSHARAQATASESAEIVLVGAAQATPELQLVVAELLHRDGVHSTFERVEQFTPDALLAQPDQDQRVHVFITLPTPELARLYLRGPYGRRFLLRELTLRSGIDELGRESIAQVVATSAQALLHSSAGIDREAARADLAREQAVTPVESAPAVTPAPMTPAAATPAPTHKTTLGFELALRASLAWSGSELATRGSGGLELGLSERASRTVVWRQRLVLEESVAQALSTPQLVALVQASAARLGQDVGVVHGIHSGYLGLAVGLDVLRMTPERAQDPTYSLAKAHTQLVPMLRGELRYELALSALFAALGVYADVALHSPHYEVRDGTQLRRVAQSPLVTPGVALSLGWHSN